MVEAIASFAAILLFGISLLHIYWAFGGKWGKHAVIPEQGGQRVFTPGVPATLLIAVLVSAAGMLLLLEAGLFTLFSGGEFIIRSGSWICAAAFSLRVVGEFNYFGIFKKKQMTSFSRMDSYLYIPLCAFLSFAFILVLVT
ncbi:DUF3995 domain-containing protein [Paenibacillus sp. GCM10027626]|uniref:DUF3995 domain-containing protein n=1 Tax=Paenibacillus sp. GCM10027626 TaxID=3273411 RepID=UPI00362AC7CE